MHSQAKEHVLLPKGKTSNNHLHSAGWLSSKSACCLFCHRAYFFVYAVQFLSCSLRQKHPLLDVNPVGSTFNIQNSIPHKSQKPKAVAEINRPIEFQRGTTGVAESTKKRTKALFEETDILLGPRDRAFESHYSDQRKKGL